jgi:hemerythrin
MALFEWSDVYSVGIAGIDDQHKRLVGMINSLDDAMRQGKGRAVLQGIISGMVRYTAEHFTAEEGYFERFGYPEAGAHSEAHRAFVGKVSDFREGFESGRIGLSTDVMNFLTEWLKGHILGMDKKYGPFLKDKGAS